MKDSKKYLISGIILVVIAIIYTILVKTVDVGAIGPINPETGEATSVGFQAINGFFMNLLEPSKLFYKISKYAGLLPFLLAGFYAYTGCSQLVKGKSLKKVDNKIIAIGAFYVVVLIVYIFFEKVVINYRPVIMDAELEASYPSSHTLLAICFCGSSLLISKFFIKKDLVRRIVNIATVCLMVLIVVSRFISGVHWASDIVGGIIISLALLNIFYIVILKLDEKKKKRS